MAIMKKWKILFEEALAYSFNIAPSFEPRIYQVMNVTFCDRFYIISFPQSPGIFYFLFSSIYDYSLVNILCLEEILYFWNWIVMYFRDVRFWYRETNKDVIILFMARREIKVYFYTHRYAWQGVGQGEEWGGWENRKF